MAGWWFQPTPLKDDGVNVSWDDEIPNYIWKVIQNSMVPVTTNQISSLIFRDGIFNDYCMGKKKHGVNVHER